MGEPDVTMDVESVDYESDEYYDEQGRRVYEADFPTRPQYVPEGDMAVVVNEPDCKPSLEPEMETIKTEVPSDDSSPEEVVEEEMFQQPEESFQQPEVKVNVEFTPRSAYTLQEMRPKDRDPLCKSKTELACFWPVYVDNFWCENRQDEFGCVRKYFAWKGLHVRWWYRKQDEYYYEFQARAGIFDMLVYFVSEQDANLAIQLCHRDNYLGYTLNVFPGRMPVYFDRNLSVLAQKMKSGKVYSEHFFEQHVKRLTPLAVDVKCTVKFDTKTGAMEFGSLKHKQAAQKRIRLFKLEDVTEERLQKQRFLEQDLLAEIEAHLTANPAALKLVREDKYVTLLLASRRPKVDPKPKLQIVPLRSGPTKRAQAGQFRRKLKKMEKDVIRKVAAGIQPKCYDKRHKKQFNQMVENATSAV